jgi:hypothetical protein
MDQIRASLIRFGMELERLGAHPAADPGDTIRFGLARLAILANHAGVECKLSIAREQTETDQFIEDVKADLRELAQRN